MKNDDVVITGIGVVSSIGIGKETFWNSLIQGNSGIKSVTKFDTADYSSKTAGEINDFSTESFIDDRRIRRIGDISRYAVVATKLAISDSKLTTTEKVGLMLTTTHGAIEYSEQYHRLLVESGPNMTSPMLFSDSIFNAPASHVSILFNITDYVCTFTGSNTATISALEYAVNMLKTGKLDIVLFGAAEEFCEILFEGYSDCKILAPQNGTQEISCPFDRRHNGFIFGEGAGIIVLESFKHAQLRKAQIYGKIAGIGIVSYDQKGEGLVNSIEKALNQSRIKKDAVDYISANANSIPSIDLYETLAIKKTFNNLTQNIGISATKSMLGEMFAASTIFQIIDCLLAIKYDKISPTVNFENGFEGFDLDCVHNTAIEKKVKIAMANTVDLENRRGSVIFSG